MPSTHVSNMSFGDVVTPDVGAEINKGTSIDTQTDPSIPKSLPVHQDHVKEGDEGAWPSTEPETSTSSYDDGSDDRTVIPFPPPKNVLTPDVSPPDPAEPDLPVPPADQVDPGAGAKAGTDTTGTGAKNEQLQVDPGAGAKAGTDTTGTGAKNEQLPTPDPSHEQFDQVDDVEAPSEDNTGVILGVLGVVGAFAGLYVASKKGWI